MTDPGAQTSNERELRDPCADRDLSVAIRATDIRLLATLPTAPPEVARLEFTQRGEGWPPKPQGAEQVRRIHAQEAAGALTDELDRMLRSAALQDARIREALGERYVHVQSDAVLAQKGQQSDCSGPLQTRLTFYSYDRQNAVEVLMSGSSRGIPARRD
jgi:hypothetical protein